MQRKDLYTILQVHRDASPEVIKAAHKSLSAKYHPDRDGSADAARQFAEIQAAYDVLSDPTQRRQYDLNPESARTPSVESVAVLRTDGSSTFLTLAEHQRRGWQEAAGCDLSNQDFSGVSFRNAKLAGAKLDGSRFIGCDFRGADLSNCSAKRCQFDRADLAGAKLINSDLSNCGIRDAKLFGIGRRWQSSDVDPNSRFTRSDHTKSDLSQTADRESGVVLQNVNFRQSDLSGTAFSRPHEVMSEVKHTSTTWGTPQQTKIWTKQYFRSAEISGCDFSEASLSRCDCREMKLTGCQFGSTNLQQTDMQKCDIGGLDLSTASLLDTNLTECLYSGTTKFPNGYAIPKGARNSDEIARQTNEDASKEFTAMAVLAFCVLVFGMIVLLSSR